MQPSLQKRSNARPAGDLQQEKKSRLYWKPCEEKRPLQQCAVNMLSIRTITSNGARILLKLANELFPGPFQHHQHVERLN